MTLKLLAIFEALVVLKLKLPAKKSEKNEGASKGDCNVEELLLRIGESWFYWVYYDYDNACEKDEESFSNYRTYLTGQVVLLLLVWLLLILLKVFKVVVRLLASSKSSNKFLLLALFLLPNPAAVLLLLLVAFYC